MPRYVIWRFTQPRPYCTVLRVGDDPDGKPAHGPASLAQCRAWCALRGRLRPPVEFREG